jgi:hypothetical protein
MPGATVDIGTGATITFGTSSWTAELLDIQWSGISRESVETSHMGTAAPGVGKFGNRTHIPGDLSDPGELRIQFHLDPDDEPPIDQPAETITVAFPLVSGDATPANWAGSGFATDFSLSVPLEDKMTGEMTVKFTGNITQTAAA